MTSFKISEIEGAAVDKKHPDIASMRLHPSMSKEEYWEGFNEAIDAQASVRLRFKRGKLVRLMVRLIAHNDANPGIGSLVYKAADAIIAAGPDLLETVKE